MLNYYKGLNISTSFFSNLGVMKERSIALEWDKLGKPYDRNEWHMVRLLGGGRGDN